MSAPVLACTDATRLLAGCQAAIAAYDARRAYWQHVEEHQRRAPVGLHAHQTGNDPYIAAAENISQVLRLYSYE